MRKMFMVKYMNIILMINNINNGKITEKNKINQDMIKSIKIN